MLRVLIVDDEEPARKRLRSQLRPLVRDNRLAVVGEAANGREALDLLEAHPADLLFLDVQMPGWNGFDVVERLPPEHRPEVVFVTAYDEYAVRAFDANAVDYLLKPVSRERLQESVRRVEQRERNAGAPPVSEEQLARLLEWLDGESLKEDAQRDEDQEPLRQLSIPYRDRILVVPIERLVAAEVSDGVTRLVLLDEELEGRVRLSQYIVSHTLEQLDTRLDPDDFMRVHRSAIVALGHIREMVSWFSGRYKLRLTGGHEVIASRDRSKSLRRRLSL